MKDLDKRAYDIVCNWYKIIDFNPIHNNIDYSQIIRFYLWDKVGRALRIKNNIDFGEEEVYKKEIKKYSQYYTPLISNGKYRKNIFNRKKIIFIPFQAPHTNKFVELLSKKKEFKLLSKHRSNQFNDNNVIRKVNFKKNIVWSNKLFQAVILAFKKLDINLINQDLELLKIQISGVVEITLLAEEELKKYKPKAVYVHSDNHPPYISYVLAAKKYGIPTFTYQHGLDCEHYYLNDCYADFVGVWSKDRKEKYELYSSFQAKKIKVIGNIFIDKENFNRNYQLENTILFITRPHRPIKCYSPSRNYLEGKYIVETILDFLVVNPHINLIVKTHPMDYIHPYIACINDYGLNQRVEFSNESVHELFTKVKMIVTEDSTAGAEAMYYNLPIILAHFAKNKPVIPLIKYDFVFKGYEKKELIKNLEFVFNLSNGYKHVDKRSREDFISEYIPLGDVQELVKFITENIK